MPRCWGLEPHSSEMESKAWLGTDEISTLAIAALEVVVFFVCGAESGWHSERLNCRAEHATILPETTSDTEERNQTASGVSQMHRVHALSIQSRKKGGASSAHSTFSPALLGLTTGWTVSSALQALNYLTGPRKKSPRKVLSLNSNFPAPAWLRRRGTAAVPVHRDVSSFCFNRFGLDQHRTTRSTPSIAPKSNMVTTETPLTPQQRSQPAHTPNIRFNPYGGSVPGGSVPGSVPRVVNGFEGMSFMSPAADASLTSTPYNRQTDNLKRADQIFPGVSAQSRNLVFDKDLFTRTLEQTGLHTMHQDLFLSKACYEGVETVALIDEERMKHDDGIQNANAKYRLAAGRIKEVRSELEAVDVRLDDTKNKIQREVDSAIAKLIAEAQQKFDECKQRAEEEKKRLKNDLRLQNENLGNLKTEVLNRENRKNATLQLAQGLQDHAPSILGTLLNPRRTDEDVQNALAKQKILIDLQKNERSINIDNVSGANRNLFGGEAVPAAEDHGGSFNATSSNFAGGSSNNSVPTGTTAQAPNLGLGSVGASKGGQPFNKHSDANSVFGGGGGGGSSNNDTSFGFAGGSNGGVPAGTAQTSVFGGSSGGLFNAASSNFAGDSSNNSVPTGTTAQAPNFGLGGAGMDVQPIPPALPPSDDENSSL
ncbi:hypothetical protein THAOC_02072 [Thalassiosira oceanica]|uniref:Uncharacterized protein n=1 Tax=Thalassiosira oceanica TaxID=159749 RepID=K0TBZ3_THAOC|nr:hypothetical protein THAOC_02072 [Thalassiosira oceanica]|eukprot:EJK76183.1 hypothetical protein THAOC_02072 [Thalassiosira oceanica]